MLTSSKLSGQVSDHSVVESLKVVSLVIECLVAIIILLYVYAHPMVLIFYTRDEYRITIVN